MSARKVDVLAVMSDAVNHSSAYPTLDTVAMAEARTAVAELIAADVAFDAARAAWLASDWKTDAEKAVFDACKSRRAAALAKVQGGPP